MRVLGIESSTQRGSVSLVANGTTLVTLAHEQPSAHAERLLPLLNQALEIARWDRCQIERVGVGVGPGSFTGLRVGLALAQGLALGLSVPLIGISSLRLLVHPITDRSAGARVAIVDARREECFVAAYGADGQELIPPSALPRDNLRGRILARLGAVPRWAVGPEAARVFPECTWSSPTPFPCASSAGLLAAQAPIEGRPVSPLYVREADAVRPVVAPDALVTQLAKPPPS